jgi:hypothetical protein
MPLPDELTEQILDRDDGSCRDINFDRLDWDGAIAVIAMLLRDASSATATEGDGQSLDVAAVGGTGICQCARNTRSCHVVLTDVADLFQSLQAYVCPEEDGSAFVELTFFPDEVIRGSFTTDKLVDYIIHLSTIGRANNFYLRYENASWKLGSTGHGTGVITTWHEIRNAK